MKYDFPRVEPPPWVNFQDWLDWKWQLKNSLKSLASFESYFKLTEQERSAFSENQGLFKIRTTPYYARLARARDSKDPIRRIQLPHIKEIKPGHQQMLDPLGEIQNNPASRIIHRYPDRLLLLLTDQCAVYCRYCTRKHFTGHDQAFLNSKEYEEALTYIRTHTEVREVILSGGDPLSLSDQRLRQVLTDLRKIEHIDLIRIGSRLPVVAPMRVTDELVSMLKEFNPLFMMTHFNHPRELTDLAAQSLLKFVDNGIPVFNQMVLLNGINNHEKIVEALSRRLLYLRVKPYYMFQCDPSLGTDHLRTSVDDSLKIQRALWGRVSGLAIPNLSLDIPNGGGKAGLVPNFEIAHEGERRVYRGWDGIESEYVSPPDSEILTPPDIDEY